MYPDLIKKFPNCKIETEERLISLFKRSFGSEKKFVTFKAYSKNKKKINEFDKILYAGSLGKLFRNKLSSFPKKNFLIDDKSKTEQMRKKIDKISNLKKIGLAWRSKREVIGEDKSISLDILSSIINLKNFTFINLQYGDTKDEIVKFNKKNINKIYTINDLDLFNDFEAISSLLTNLDLFITVSNSTAHLAGALGVPTWLIKPKNHALFHYWNQPNDKTPWYPSVKLFKYKGNWEETITQIKKLLIKNFN